MISGRKVLALLTARGGSKGLPGKNIRPAGGKPLLAWSIEAAQRAASVDRTVLSSEDARIIEVARAHGCEVPFVRPTELATDAASSMDVVRHALGQLPGYDVVVLLQPTSPLRTAVDIDAACELLERSGAPACVAVCPVEQSPYWMYIANAEGRLQPLLDTPHRTQQRQCQPEVVIPNGALYVASVPWLLASGSFMTTETVAYRMPRERSLDIDTTEDFEAFVRQVEATRG